MRKKRFHFAVLGLTCWMGFHTPTHAGLFDDEEARRAIIDLRQKVELLDQTRLKDTQTLQQSVQNLQSAQDVQSPTIQSLKDENAQLKRSLLDTQTQIEQLRTEFAKQVGSNEQLAKDLSELQRRQRDLVQGVDDRLRRFEPVKVNPDGKEFLADPTEVKDYEAALALFRKGEFKLATQIFGDFLRRYPQTGYQSLGLFWLGNAQYANREYRDAITNFKSSIEANAASNKAPEAMLAIGNCQIELKDAKSARRTLEELIKTYPQSEAAIAAKDRLARLR